MELPTGYKLIKSAVVGSVAYGLANETSDVDTLGTYIVPAELVLGLRGHKYTTESKVTNDPDVTLHEVGKALSLALKCNPTVLELFFAEPADGDPSLAQMLDQAGRAAIHDGGVRSAYGGYAKQQAERLLRRTREGRKGFDPDLAKRTAKHGRHCFRLLIQAEHLLTTGDIILDVSAHKDEIFSMGELAERDPQAFYEAFEERDAHLRSLPSVLSEEPDFDQVNSLLIAMRATTLDTAAL